MSASGKVTQVTCNAGSDIIFTDRRGRCGKSARRVCVVEFAGDPGIIEAYCETHIAALRRDGYSITAA
jgi:hypothetical protein